MSLKLWYGVAIVFIGLSLQTSTAFTRTLRVAAFQRCRPWKLPTTTTEPLFNNIRAQTPNSDANGAPPPLEKISQPNPKEVSRRVFEFDDRPVVLFDGVCNLCNGAVNLALDWDPKGRLRFAALQSNVGRALLQKNGRSADDISSIVLVTKKGAFIKSDAILIITEELTPFKFLPVKPAARLGRYVIPGFLRDLIYDGVADNRYSLMGKRNECRFDSDGEFEDRFVDDGLATMQM